MAESSSAAAVKLLRAATQGDVAAVVTILDDSGQEINNLKARGSTALHEAAKAGQLEVVKELVRRSAHVNAINRSGCTPLHFATLCKDKQSALDTVGVLLQAGGHVNAMSERMDTPLHFASYCQPAPLCGEVCRRLLEERALVNSRNRNSESPLLNAVLNNNVDAVKVLIEHHADINLKNAVEKSLRDVAEERGCQEVLDLLTSLMQPPEPATASSDDLRSLTDQVKSALESLQSVDKLGDELSAQTAMARAYESAGMMLAAELDSRTRSRIARTVLGSLRKCQSGCSGAFSQEQLLQDLAALLLVARCPDGVRILYREGLADVFGFLEMQASERKAGHREVTELRLSLVRLQEEVPNGASGRRSPSTSTSSASSDDGRGSSPAGSRTAPKTETRLTPCARTGIRSSGGGAASSWANTATDSAMAAAGIPAPVREAPAPPPVAAWKSKAGGSAAPVVHKVGERAQPSTFASEQPAVPPDQRLPVSGGAGVGSTGPVSAAGPAGAGSPTSSDTALADKAEGWARPHRRLRPAAGMTAPAPPRNAR